MWPTWVTVPLLFLGLVFLSLPFVPLNSWFDYFLGLAIAIVLGVWSHRRYRVEVQRPADGLCLVRVEDRKRCAAADDDLPRADS